MTRMTGPDCAVMCNLINTHTHTHTTSGVRDRSSTSCRLGVESTAEVAHKSVVATWCASEQKEKIEIRRLLLTDFQSQVCIGNEKE